MIAATYIKPNSGIPTERILRRVLLSKGLSQKIAALTMGGVSYEATFSRALAGLGPLDFHALVMLDTKVLWKFFRLVLSAKLKAEETQLFERRVS